jgi:hypothetical protein
MPALPGFITAVGMGHTRSSLGKRGPIRMLYAILCYNDEKTVHSWSKEEDAAVMTKLAAVQEKLKKAGKLGPVARLMPTTAATTLRKDREPALIIDGPFAETKEQLLGFYVVDATGLEDALEIAKDLGRANPGGSYEIRPIAVFKPGDAA